MNYYADLSPDTAAALHRFDRAQLLGLIQELAGMLIDRDKLIPSQNGDRPTIHLKPWKTKSRS